MAVPFTLIVAGVTGAGTGGDLLALPAPSATTTPYVDLGSLSMTLAGDGNGGSMSFDVIQPKTPSGTTPWWRSNGVYDNARVQFFDSRYSATTPLFLGFITNIEAVLLENGIGTRATVSVSDATLWLEKIIISKPSTSIRSVNDSFSLGSPASTDADILNAALAIAPGSSLNQQLLNTAVVNLNRFNRINGAATTIGKQDFRAAPLRSIIDQITEEAGGVLGIQYQYWVDATGRLNYGPRLSAPAYANAPAEIVTDPADVRTGSASATTRILARNLTVALDHSEIVKKAFVQTNTNLISQDPAAAYERTYTGTYPTAGAGLAARNGPIPAEIISAPKIANTGSKTTRVGAIARAIMTSRAQPVRTVSFTIAGENLSQTASPDWSYGYSQGYALTAASTYTLVKAWVGGQYIKINAPSLNVSNEIMFVSAVTMKFAEGGGSYQVQYDVEADYRRKYITGFSRLAGGE
jgi:hypothetical protein